MHENLVLFLITRREIFEPVLLNLTVTVDFKENALFFEHTVYEECIHNFLKL
jgi:hypothetical protein